VSKPGRKKKKKKKKKKGYMEKNKRLTYLQTSDLLKY